MWRAVVVEDEQSILELHVMLLKKFGPFQVVGTYQSPSKALKEIPGKELDVLLLDIEMPGMTGIQLAEKLVNAGIDVPIVFSTAYTQYAIDAFRVQALDYLLKPLTPKSVEQIDMRLQKYYGLEQRKRGDWKLYVQLYGDPYVKVGENFVKWPTRVTEELFYYFLLQEGQICSKWRIVEDIWPNVEEKRAQANLYNTIYRIRQLLAELEIPMTLKRINSGYQMDVNQHIIFEKTKDPYATLLETKGYLWAYNYD